MKLPEPRQLPDGRWWMRYSAPPGPGGKRRQPRVYGRTAKECRENYVTAMGDIQAGRLADDRRTKFADYLDRRLRWWESEDDIKPSTLASYREAIELYFKPGLGHLRLADLRDHHFRDLAAAMRKINTPAADGFTLHGLRHGAATMLLAAGQPPKVVSEILGHSTVAFTMDVYTEVAEELAESAAVALAAYVPRASRKPADKTL